MGLLKPAENESAFLKAGILGFQGSGKTYTATDMAIGLCQLIKNDKVAYFDTEAGSDYVIPKFKESGVVPYSYKGKAFKDLCAIVRECESENFGVLIIDSISHIWRELQDAYRRSFGVTPEGKIKKQRLVMQDWAVLKGQWSEFTDLYLNSKLHIIMLGRAGYEYDFEENEDTGKKEIFKSGTKMKVESEMGYEPSLLIEMEAVRRPDGKGFIHQATIIKDRTDTLNGKTINAPRFKDFLPIISMLNIGGTHMAVDTSRTSEDLFESPDRSWEKKKRQREIALDDLDEVLTLNGLSGQAQDVKTKRMALLKDVFIKSSKTHIEEEISLETLLSGIQEIRNRLQTTNEQPTIKNHAPQTAEEAKNAST